MATILDTPTSAVASSAQGDQHVAVYGIGWDGYEEMLRLWGDRSRPQMVYLDGDLYLMSPSRPHERLTERLGMIVRVVVEELDIPCEPTRETTFRLGKKKGGVQPDDSFYLANHAVIAARDGKEDVDLNIDPPPDLVIEVVHSHPADRAVEVLRRFGVPEVWVGDVDALKILTLGTDGHHAESATSLAFPFLTAAEIYEWATRSGIPATRWVRDLRRWSRRRSYPGPEARSNLDPRAAR